MGMEIVRLNPRFVGQVFRLLVQILFHFQLSLNPRFVGQVFRHFPKTYAKSELLSLNPRFVGQVFRQKCLQSNGIVMIDLSLNPRFVGQVFRQR